MSEAAYPAALALGAVSGMRSMMAPAAISWAARRSGVELGDTPFHSLETSSGWKATVALALGEMVADKLPFVPNRTEGAVLLTRALSGAGAGAAVFKARHRSVALGAAVGAAAAIGVAFAAFHLRKKAARKFDVSDQVIALAEDGLALGLGLLVVMNLKPAGSRA